MTKNQSQSQVLAKDLSFTQSLIIFSSLLGLTFIVPALIHNQAVTGPIVNAILLIAASIVSPSSAMLIGMLPSTVALSRGLLPLALAPMIPFIILGNALYIYLFSQLKNKSFGLGVAVASVAKFSLLFGASQLVLQNLLPLKLATKVTQMMSWSQLATALIGGFLAWIVLSGLSLMAKKSESKN